MVLHTAEWVKGGGGTAVGGRVHAAWNVSAGLYVAPDNPVKTVWVTCCQESNPWSKEGAELARIVS